MSVASVTEAGRRAAEARMTDTWTIGTDVGWTYDEVLGREVQTVTPLFTTPGRLKIVSTQARETQVGERTVVETRRELHIPVDSPAVPVNAVAQCTAIGSTTDPTVLNIVLRVAGPASGSQTTARRLEVVEVLS